MRKLIFFLFIFFLFKVLSYAEVLNWIQLKNFLKENNPEIQNALRNIDKYKLLYKSSKAEFYPDFSISGSVRKSKNSDTGSSIGIAGKLDLFRGFKNSISLDISKIEVENRKLELKRILADKTYNLRIAYGEVVYLKNLIKILEKILKRKKENLDIVVLRYEAGKEDIGVKLKQEADFKASLFELEKRKRELEVKKTKILKELNANFETFEITGTLKFTFNKDIELNEIIGYIPEYQIKENEIELAKLNLNYDRAPFYPELNLTGSVSKSGDKFSLDENSWNLGVNISYPFFSKGKNFYNLEISKIELKKSEGNFSDKVNELKLNLKEVHTDLINSVENIEVVKLYLNATKERAKIARIKYVNGLISYEDWDRIENDYINAEKNLLEAEFSAFRNYALFLKVIGREEL
ncbi:MAG: TolC family protein [Elusimicrobia bacterium]|nr:TolC family protein [Elusimicrobiota bacterium]